MSDRQQEFKALIEALRDLSGSHFYLLRDSTATFKKDASVETSVQRRVDRLHFAWSFDYWDKLNKHERLFMTLHTCEHLLSKHYTRLGPKLKNKKTRAAAEAAIDLAANHGIMRRFNFKEKDLPYLRQNGAWVDTVMPELSMSPDLSIEEYYFIISQEQQRRKDEKKDEQKEQDERESGDDGGEGEADEEQENDSSDNEQESDDENDKDSSNKKDSKKKLQAGKKGKKDKDDDAEDEADSSDSESSDDDADSDASDGDDDGDADPDEGDGEEEDSDSGVDDGDENESEEDGEPEDGEADKDGDSEEGDVEGREPRPLDNHETGEEGEQDISDLLEQALKALQKGEEPHDPDEEDGGDDTDDKPDDDLKDVEGDDDEEDDDEDPSEYEDDASAPNIGGLDVDDKTPLEATEEMEAAFGLAPGTLAGAGIAGAVKPPPIVKDTSPEREWRKFGYRLEKSVRVDKGHTSWTPNKRFAAMTEFQKSGMFLPSYESPKKSHIRAIIFVDTSGSCTWMLNTFMTIIASIPKEIFEVTAYTFTSRSIPFDIKNPTYASGGTSFKDFEEKFDAEVLKDKQAGKDYLHHAFVLTDGGVRDFFSPKNPHMWHFMMYNPLTPEQLANKWAERRANNARGINSPSIHSETKWIDPRCNIMKLDPFLPKPVLDLLNQGATADQIERFANQLAVREAQRMGKKYIAPRNVGYSYY